MITPFEICFNFGDLQIFPHRKVWGQYHTYSPSNIFDLKNSNLIQNKNKLLCILKICELERGATHERACLRVSAHCGDRMSGLPGKAHPSSNCSKHDRERPNRPGVYILLPHRLLSRFVEGIRSFGLATKSDHPLAGGIVDLGPVWVRSSLYTWGQLSWSPLSSSQMIWTFCFGGLASWWEVGRDPLRKTFWSSPSFNTLENWSWTKGVQSQ